MLIDIRHLDAPVSNALYDFTNRRITRALGHFRRPFLASMCAPRT